MTETILCNGYEIHLERLVNWFRQSSAKSVLLHAPNGLKYLYLCLSDLLMQKYGVTVFYSANPGYGACDIPIEEAVALQVDLIIHLGHEGYIVLPRDKIPIEVVYIPVYYVGDISSSTLNELYGVLKGFSPETVSVSSTLIESNIRGKVAAYLESRGLKVVEIKRPVLGCFYSHVTSIRADAHVIIAGGLFHPIGLGLVANQPVIALDPYSRRVWHVNKESERVLRRRLFLLFRAKDAVRGRVGLIAGTRPGQYRAELIKLLKEAASSQGFKVFSITSNYLTLERLYAIDAALSLDFYVITSCPRLPIDDLADFHKPVLTPGEFLMILTGSNKYIFPW